MLFDTGQWDAPVTAEAPPDAEPTPLEVCRPLDELDDEFEVDEEVSPVDVDGVLDAVGVALPGLVAALTALNTPTAATDANAAPTVIRLSRRIAASLA